MLFVRGGKKTWMMAHATQKILGALTMQSL